MRRQALRRWWRATTAIGLLYRLRTATRGLNEAVDMLVSVDGAITSARVGTPFVGAYASCSLQRLAELRPYAIEEVRHWIEASERASRRYFVNALYGLHEDGR